MSRETNIVAIEKEIREISIAATETEILRRALEKASDRGLAAAKRVYEAQKVDAARRGQDESSFMKALGELLNETIGMRKSGVYRLLKAREDHLTRSNRGGR